MLCNRADRLSIYDVFLCFQMSWVYWSEDKYQVFQKTPRLLSSVDTPLICTDYTQTQISIYLKNKFALFNSIKIFLKECILSNSPKATSRVAALQEGKWNKQWAYNSKLNKIFSKYAWSSMAFSICAFGFISLMIFIYYILF